VSDKIDDGGCPDVQGIDSPLVCHLAIGHDGLHWDGAENVSWKRGKPDD
jgi:hypothetical protein